MAQVTALSVSATPSGVQAFSAKELFTGRILISNAARRLSGWTAPERQSAWNGGRRISTWTASNRP